MLRILIIIGIAYGPSIVHLVYRVVCSEDVGGLTFGRQGGMVWSVLGFGSHIYIVLLDLLLVYGIYFNPYNTLKLYLARNSSPTNDAAESAGICSNKSETAMLDDKLLVSI